jgi:hypothetical protein
MNKKFLIGSRYFFDGKYNDYNPKDTDYIIIEDNPQHYTNTMTMRGRGEDLMFFKSRTKEDFINHCLNSKLSITVGKFLIPEFNEYIGFTLDDLQIIKPQIDKLDDKHLYEKYIYECYLKNNDFTLTKRQLNYAYKIYKKYR